MLPKRTFCMFKNNDTGAIRFRLIADLLLFAAFCWFPWWVSVGTAVVAFFYFQDFIEIAILGAMTDALYASHQVFSWLSYKYTIGCLALFFLLSLIKRQLR